MLQHALNLSKDLNASYAEMGIKQKTRNDLNMEWSRYRSGDPTIHCCQHVTINT